MRERLGVALSRETQQGFQGTHRKPVGLLGGCIFFFFFEVAFLRHVRYLDAELIVHHLSNRLIVKY